MTGVCYVYMLNRIQDETVVNGAQIFYRGQFGIAGDDPR